MPEYVTEIRIFRGLRMHIMSVMVWSFFACEINQTLTSPMNLYFTMVEFTIDNEKGYCMISEAFPSSNPLEETSAHTDMEPQESSANCVAISSATVKSRK